MNEFKKYVDRKCALRFMGFRGEAPDSFKIILEECEAALCEEATPRSVYVVKDKEEVSDILIGNDIASHLSDSCKVAVFAATLGSRVDALISRYQSIDVTKALVTDAEASAAIETYCDEMMKEISSRTRSSLTSRFSPGYGDYPLGIQKELLGLIDAERKIGLTSGESFMLAPSKSVTAIIGLSDGDTVREADTCGKCEMKDTCAFRKEGDRCEI